MHAKSCHRNPHNNEDPQIEEYLRYPAFAPLCLHADLSRPTALEISFSSCANDPRTAMSRKQVIDFDFVNHSTYGSRS